MDRTIVISDFDNTLFFRDDPAQTAQNLRAVQKFRKRGGIFAIATGRSLQALAQDLPDWLRYTNYLITLNGAHVYFGDSLILKHRLSKGDSRKIYNICARNHTRIFPIFFCQEEELERLSGEASMIRLWLSDQEVQKEMTTQILRIYGVHSFSYHLSDERHNFDSPRLAWLSQGMSYGMDIMRGDVTKAFALRQLQRYLPEDARIVTVGDDLNDYEMIYEHDGYVVGRNAALSDLVNPDHVTGSVSELLEGL